MDVSPSDSSIDNIADSLTVVVDLSWHRKGLYLASTVRPVSTGDGFLLVHNVLRHSTSCPFKPGSTGCSRSNALVSARFHPSKPQLLLVGRKSLRIYDLQGKAKLLRKLEVPSGMEVVTGLEVHPAGDNIIVSGKSYVRSNSNNTNGKDGLELEGKVCWYDLDMSAKPYQVFRLSADMTGQLAQGSKSTVVRSMSFHPRLPLWSYAGESGSAAIMYGMVYPDDLSKNALLVPMTAVRTDGSSAVAITCSQYHPKEPWIFVADALGNLAMFS